MNDLIHGMNEMVSMPPDNTFSFYVIPLPENQPTLLEKYVDIKYDVLYCMHGDRAVSAIRRVYNHGKGYYDYSVIVGIKDENEVLFKLKYEDCRLLYMIPSNLSYDIFMESIPSLVEHS